MVDIPSARSGSAPNQVSAVPRRAPGRLSTEHKNRPDGYQAAARRKACRISTLWSCPGVQNNRRVNRSLLYISGVGNRPRNT